MLAVTSSDGVGGELSSWSRIPVRSSAAGGWGGLAARWLLMLASTSSDGVEVELASWSRTTVRSSYIYI